MNDTEKRIETKRLLLYLLLSVGLTWLVFFIFIVTGHRWDGSNTYLENFTALGMLMPVIAHVLTRWITKEGFAMTGKGSMMLGISFRDKKWRFYLLAMLLPWFYAELGQGLFLMFYPKAFDPEYYQVLGVDKNIIFVLPLIQIVSATIVSFAAFGEEGGWRGYMMPKLIELVGMKKAVVIGGILWGLWHAPLTVVGHNFGTDYPGFPYLGILVMCIECTFMGIILTFVTEKTGSVWPAAIMHAVNNANPTILGLFQNAEKAEELMSNPMLGSILLTIPIIVIGSICLVCLLRGEKK